MCEVCNTVIGAVALVSAAGGIKVMGTHIKDRMRGKTIKLKRKSAGTGHICNDHTGHICRIDHNDKGGEFPCPDSQAENPAETPAN